MAGDDDFDMAAALMEQQQEEEEAKAKTKAKPSARSGGGGGGGAPEGMDTIEAVYDIPVEIIAVLGTASMPISQILKLGRGAVVELERIIGEPIEIHANNRLVARGEVVVVEDRLGVQITEVIRTT
ncbi:MAG: flagellar motor switch protein FliN [Magnetospirillum sp. WYHS-4]